MLQLGQEWQNRFNMYFPSAQTVRFAHLDPDRTAGTVCFSAKWWLNEKFPRRVLKDCESERGVLMHNKVRTILQVLGRLGTNMSTAHVRVAFGAYPDARWQRMQGLGICRKCKYLGECLVSSFPFPMFTMPSIANTLKGVAWSKIAAPVSQS
jgi:hypothetical protein